MLYIYIYIYIHTHTHTHIYIYTHIYTHTIYNIVKLLGSSLSDLQVLSETYPRIADAQFLLLLKKLCIRPVSFLIPNTHCFL